MSDAPKWIRIIDGRAYYELSPDSGTWVALPSTGSVQYVCADTAWQWQEALNEIKALGFGSSNDPRLQEIWDIVMEGLSEGESKAPERIYIHGHRYIRADIVKDEVATLREAVEEVLELIKEMKKDQTKSEQK